MPEAPRVVVVGAGPAGAALAWLLADRGLSVTLVERQRDFAREFRGEVLMPSGTDALEQMGLGKVLAAVPSWRPRRVTVYLNREPVVDAPIDDLALFRGHPPLAVSQPDLLEGIVAEAARRPGFRLLRGGTARELLREGGRATGVRVHTDAGHEDLHSALVVGADGRASIVRRQGGFTARQTAPPMDIVWCKLPAPAGFDGARAYAGRGHLLLAYRTFGNQIQIGWAIMKGSFGELRRRGVAQWVEEMAAHVTPDLAAHLREHAGAIRHPFLLDVVADRVAHWSAPGLLLLGDAAHTLSPVGAQGLNLALRDAIVAANHLVPALRAGGDAAALDAASAGIEAERTHEIRTIQDMQSVGPRVALTVRWWGEPVRNALGRAFRAGLGARAALGPMRRFAFGVDDVRLAV
jgi:2-polyprenyl-6-methoxyphenol hydroxylase-like FAD-dependent oxidoreductase